MVIVKWVPIVSSRETVCLGNYWSLIQEIEKQNGHLSAERFIYKTIDRSFQEKKIVPQAEGIYKCNDRNNDDCNNDSSQ